MMLNKNYKNANLCILVRSGRDYDSDNGNLQFHY